MTVSVQAGSLSAADLEAWVSDQAFHAWVDSLAGSSPHALIEYVHRFAFVDWTGFLRDLEKHEVGRLGLRGRIFWETGQVAWRRLDGGRCGVCLLLDAGPCTYLPAAWQPAQDAAGTFEQDEDLTLLLWGTYDGQAFMELRVQGSRPLSYPDTIARAGKTYPVLEIRVYRNEGGEPSMWRFLRPTARNEAEWPSPWPEET